MDAFDSQIRTESAHNDNLIEIKSIYTMTENNQQYENPLGAVAAKPEEEDADLAQFLSTVNWKAEAIEEQLFDPTIPDLPVCYSLEWQNVAFAPLGGIAGMNGRPGNGKTMSFSTMIAAILHPDKNYQGLRCLLPDEPSVLYIDTEMEMVNTQRTVRRIYQMVGWPQMTPQERLHTICLREVNDATSRWRKILKAIWQFKPTVVFLDGLIDVVNDFNDNKECQERIYQCMSVASHYNISMWCLLHLNPGSDKAVGHLGSFLERKATDIWLTAQDKETQQICISHEKHRMRKAPDINYSVADDEKHYGIPTLTMHPIEPSNDEDERERKPIREAMLSIKWAIDGIRYSDIESGLKTYGITSKRKISDYITLAQQYGIIEQNKDTKRYFILYDGANVDGQTRIDNSSMGDDDEGMPF